MLFQDERLGVAMRDRIDAIARWLEYVSRYDKALRAFMPAFIEIWQSELPGGQLSLHAPLERVIRVESSAVVEVGDQGFDRLPVLSGNARPFQNLL